jgi:RNA polymerase sigma-70 factor, ECF subfamily
MPGWEEVAEPQLVQEAQNGSAGAFGELYTRHAERVFRFLYAHVNDRLDAEDLTAEVFMRAWKALPQFRQKGIPFTAFLFRIARNALIDFYRRSRRQKQAVSLDEAEEENRLSLPQRGEQSDPLEHQELVRLLSGLKDDYQTVIRLRFLAGLSPEETARVMKRSEGAVRVLQFRALAALRLRWKDEG